MNGLCGFLRRSRRMDVIARVSRWARRGVLVGFVCLLACGWSLGAVQNGVDVLVEDEFGILAGASVGLITNHTGRSRDGESTIDLLAAAPSVKLMTLFSPEHGIRGKLEQDQIRDGRDPKSGLPVYSLYGERRAPSVEQLKGIDTLVFDIQDIGCRFYTYISTLRLCMEVAAERGLRFVVLDRVNPIGGKSVEGPVLLGEEKFTATHAMAIRHGMTVGELAGMMNAERKIGARVEVVKVKGWRRSKRFDATGLPWIDPSPNIRKLEAALVYPGIGLLEFSISVGRGTDAPFEVLGAPYVNGSQLAEELQGRRLKGVTLEPVTFAPSASVFAGERCEGLRLRVTDADTLEPVRLGVEIAAALRRLYPATFDMEKMNILLNHGRSFAALKSGLAPEEILETWDRELDDFQRRRSGFLLY